MGYRGKVEEQEKARELRKQSWTLQEIADELGVSKSSVSLWVRDVEFTPKPRKSVGLARPGAQRRAPNRLAREKQQQVSRMHARGVERVARLSDREFLMAGIALYAAEGSKTDGTVSMANTDPQILEFFCAWLRRFFDIDESRLRVRVYLHDGLDLAMANSHWSRVTGIPVERFRKPYRAVPREGIRHTKHVRGCATVSYSCSATHREIMGMIAGLFGRTARADVDPQAMPSPSADWRSAVPSIARSGVAQ